MLRRECDARVTGAVPRDVRESARSPDPGGLPGGWRRRLRSVLLRPEARLSARLRRTFLQGRKVRQLSAPQTRTDSREEIESREESSAERSERWREVSVPMRFCRSPRTIQSRCGAWAVFPIKSHRGIIYLIGHVFNIPVTPWCFRALPLLYFCFSYGDWLMVTGLR